MDSSSQHHEENENIVENELPEDSAAGSETAKSSLEQDKEAESFKARFYYLAAEMENLKKRFQKEKEGIIKYSNEKILLDLIEVIDNLERTMKVLENDQDEKIKNLFVGIKMVHQQFCNTLDSHGLQAVKSEKALFDPNLHEAVAQREVENGQDMEILEEYQKGYLLAGRLIRAAKVVVAKVK